MTSVLVVSNVGPDANVGRAAKLATREERCGDRDVEIVWGLAAGSSPFWYVLLAPISLLRVCYLGWRADVDVVQSISNPFFLQLFGWVTSRLLGVPWIAEFRDPMVEIPDRDPDAPLTRLTRWVERFTVTRCDHVCWIDGIQIEDEYFVDTYGIDPARVTKLPFMGYDRTSFEAAEPASFDRFTVTYAGSFYEGWIEPHAFLEGLATYVGETDVDASDLQVLFYGDWDASYDALVDELDLGDVVAHHDFVPHEEIVGVLLGSDCCLYVGGTDPRNENNVPSKLWDYVGSGTPILAIVEPTFRVADFVEDHGLGLVADPGDGDAIADAIGRFHRGEVDVDPRSEQFTRERHLTAMFDLVESVAGA